MLKKSSLLNQSKPSPLKALICVLLAFFVFLQPLVVLAEAENTTQPAETANQSVEIASSEAQTVAQSEKTAPEIQSTQPSDVDANPAEPVLDTKSDVPTQAPKNGAVKTSGLSTSSYSNIADLGKSNLNQGQVLQKPETDTTSGALTYAYGFNEPPGRLGMQPNLKLNYNSQNGSPVNVFGLGWSLNVPEIFRENRKGSQQIFTTNNFRSTFSGKLTDLGFGNFTAENETGDFLKYRFSNNVWQVYDKAGKIYSFGQTAQSRQDNPADIAQIYRWMLEKISDSNGNTVNYFYTKDQGQIYLSSIAYTGSSSDSGAFEIRFVYESNMNSPTYNAGFRVVTAKRLKTVQMFTNGQQTREYALNYRSKTLYQSINLLSSITETPFLAGVAQTALAPTSFSYSGTDQMGFVLDPNFEKVGGDYFGNNPVDVNGDGLIDALGSGSVSINNGHGDFTQLPYQSLPQPPQTGPNSYVNPDYFYPYLFYSDINNDQKPDIIYATPVGLGSPNDDRVYLNTGNGWNSTSDFHTMHGELAGAPSGLPRYGITTFVFDINGDGLPDQVRLHCFDIGYCDMLKEVSLNTGTSWVGTSNWQIPNGLYFSISGPQPENGRDIRAMDVNGDGLVDLAVFTLGSSIGQNDQVLGQVFLNNGSGWQAEPGFKVPGGADTSISLWLWYSTRSLDFNGDGLPDMLGSKSLTGKPYYKYGWVMSNGQWQNSSTTPALPDFLITGSDHNPNPLNDDFSNEMHKFATLDVNGDGLSDLESSQFIGWVPGGPSKRFVWINQAQKQGLLKAISYPTGGLSTITYKPATQLFKSNGDFANNLPNSFYVVTQIQTSDGLGNLATSNFSYEGGKMYISPTDPTDRRFASFSNVTATDPSGNVSKSYFHQGDSSDTAKGEYQDDFSKIGKPYRVEQYDQSGNLFKVTVNKWDKQDLGGGASFIFLAQSLSQDYDGTASHKDQATSFSYDSAGNVLQATAYGEVLGNSDGSFSDIGTDKLLTTNTYAVFVGASSAVSSFPASSIVTDQDGVKVRDTQYFYDSLPQGQVSLGNLTQESKYKDQTTGYISSSKTYNSFGQVLTETDPLGNTTSYTYDSLSLYPAAVKNPLNQTTAFTYDYATGKVLSSTDPNNLTSSATLDGLGRVLTKSGPDVANSSQQVVLESFVYNDTPGSVSVKKSALADDGVYADSITYFDGLGRAIQTKAVSQLPGKFVTKDLVYNPNSQVAKESLPYFSSSFSLTPATTDNALYANFTYDPLGRTVAINRVNGTQSFAFGNWQVMQTDELGKQKRFSYDPFGRLVKVEEFNQGQIYTTTYQYTPAGELQKITDALGNVRQFTYDNLGNRLTAEDLHKPSAPVSAFGKWTNKYDNNLRLLQQIDPNGKVVNFSYDGLNRLTVKDVVTNNGTTNVLEETYTYDNCFLGVGKLCLANYNRNSTAYKYDGLGNIQQASSTNPYNGKFSTDYVYSKAGKLKQITNPDGSIVKYTYGPAGQLSQVAFKEAQTSSVLTNLVNNIEYAPTGQAVKTEFSNGVVSEKVLDSSQLYRLSNLKTTNSSSTLLQNIAYTYDAVGNITQISDQSETKAKKLQSFAYDDLYRLVSASATSTATSTPSFSQTFSYDALGNLLTKSDIGSYFYEGSTATSTANPHAVTKVDGLGKTFTFGYDKNGNTTSLTASDWRDTRAFSYTYDNKISSIYKKTTATSTVGSLMALSYYDHSGQRVVNLNGTLLTQYPTKYFNQNSQNIKVRHIFAGDDLVATVELKPVGTNTVSATYFVHPDHLGSSNVLTNSQGSVVQTLDYYPYGSRRLNDGTDVSQREYIGEMYDEVTGLNYLNARYYDSSRGKFLSQDPLVIINPEKFLTDPQQMNYYSYGRGNPLVFRDPTGKNAFTDDIIGYAEGFGHGFVSTVTNPVDFVVGIGKAYYDGAVSAYQLTRDTLNNPSQTYNEISTGLGLQYNEFEALSSKDQGYVVGNFTGQVDGGIVLGRAFGAGVQTVANNLKPGIQLPSYANANKLNHIFGKAEHGLEGLVKSYGSQEKAFMAIQKSTENVVTKQGITGIFKDINVKVGSYDVSVRGNVINGEVRVNTAFKKK